MREVTRLAVLLLVWLAVGSARASETCHDLSGLPACAGDARCAQLVDADADTDYADDFQKLINDFAYSDYTESTVSNETIAGNSEGFFGLTLDSSVLTAESYDRLNSVPIAILRGGSCANSGSGQSATINANGTLTGNVTTAAIAVSNQVMNCDECIANPGACTCFSDATTADFLNGPVEEESILCTRSGATSVDFVTTNTCTGSASTCNASELGALTVVWTAGTGDMTCSYNRRATNNVVFEHNATQNGRVIARWTSTPTGSTTCSYTQVTSANGGLSRLPFRIAPPTPTTSRVDFKSEVTYTRVWNSLTPLNYEVPTCAASGGDHDGIPNLIMDKSWDGVEIACDPPLKGAGNPTWCFRVSCEGTSTFGIDATDRPGVLFLGAPVVSQSAPTVVPGASGNFNYGFWMDGGTIPS